MVGFGSPMGRDGLPGGLWWFFGWVAVVMVGWRCWVVGYGFVYCKQIIIIINKNISPNSENTCQTHFLFSNLLKYYI